MSALSRLAHARQELALPHASNEQQLFRARCGWKRTFLCASDALVYERGYGHWPEPMDAPLRNSAPYRWGWLDAEADSQHREDAKAIEHAAQLGEDVS